MNSQKTINQKIITLYRQWKDEIQVKTPYLMSEKFSNIFCTGVLEDWCTSDVRILILGEEATWQSRNNYSYTDETELQECQQWILNDLKTKLQRNEKNTPFWRRVFAIREAFPNASFCWTNIDCINTDKGEKLYEKDRKALHSCDTRLVRELVDCINPTHIVFFGWHDTSLIHEFPELCSVVYPEKFGDTKFLKENGYIVKTEYNRKKVVFTYHPSWPKANSDAYIERLIEMLL